MPAPGSRIAATAWTDRGTPFVDSVPSRIEVSALALRPRRWQRNGDTLRVDRLAESLWRSGRAPFDGLTLATGLLPTPRLRLAASTLVSLLRPGFARTSLRTAEDWHEHDGYVTSATPATWEELAAAVADDDALVRWSPGDDRVRRAWLAGDGSFYLRWFVYDESDDLMPADPPVGGDVDLTGQAGVVEAAREALAELGVDAEVAPARDFFRRRWAG